MLLTDRLHQPSHPLSRQPDRLRRTAPLFARNHSPIPAVPANSAFPIRRPPAAISSPSIPVSPRSRRPPQPTPPPVSKSTSASPRRRAQTPPLPRRSAPPLSSCRKASRSTRAPPMARASAPTPKPASAPKKKPTAPKPQRSAPSRSTAPPCPSRSPASSTCSNPSPVTATASSFPPTASPPTSSSSVRSPPTSQTRVSSPPPSPTCPRAPSPTSTSTSSAPIAAFSPRPPKCGKYSVQSTFTPWDSALPEQSSTQFFKLNLGPDGAPCPGSTRPFSPEFHASSVDPTAGAHSPFSLELTRSDGNQDLSALNVTTPPGFSATLKGIPYCPRAAIEAAAAQPGYSGQQEEANPSCPAASQVGTAQAGAGAGDHPVYLARQGLPRRPLQGRAAQPRRDYPGDLRPL